MVTPDFDRFSTRLALLGFVILNNPIEVGAALGFDKPAADNTGTRHVLPVYYGSTTGFAACGNRSSASSFLRRVFSVSPTQFPATDFGVVWFVSNQSPQKDRNPGIPPPNSPHQSCESGSVRLPHLTARLPHLTTAEPNPIRRFF